MENKLINQINKLEYSHNQNSIPKIIHQFAPNDKTKWPKVWQICQQSWQKNFNEWEYKMWDDKDLDSFMQNNYTIFYDLLYTKYRYNIQRYDMARYFILYHYGGIYADMDYLCFKNFWHLLPFDRVSVAESENIKEKYQNALIISPQKNIFWQHIFKELIINFNIDLDYNSKPDYLTNSMFHVLSTTGPIFIEKAIESSEIYKPNILKRDKFSVNSKESYAYHISTAMWVDLQEYIIETEKSFGTIFFDLVKKWLKRRRDIQINL
jgi:mannosyltransferase OCH1-like enzyme